MRDTEMGGTDSASEPYSHLHHPAKAANTLTNTLITNSVGSPRSSKKRLKQDARRAGTFRRSGQVELSNSHGRLISSSSVSQRGYSLDRSEPDTLRTKSASSEGPAASSFSREPAFPSRLSPSDSQKLECFQNAKTPRAPQITILPRNYFRPNHATTLAEIVLATNLYNLGAKQESLRYPETKQLLRSIPRVR